MRVELCVIDLTMTQADAEAPNGVEFSEPWRFAIVEHFGEDGPCFAGSKFELRTETHALIGMGEQDL